MPRLAPVMSTTLPVRLGYTLDPVMAVLAPYLVGLLLDHGPQTSDHM
jgi:hypothetical protein